MQLVSIFFILAPLLASPTAAIAQVAFQPEGCEFRVSFLAAPTITMASVPSMKGTSIETTIAEFNARLDDGHAHYFRAECTQTRLTAPPANDVIEDMYELAILNRLQEPRVWVERLPTGLSVGRIRAKINSGLREYMLDIRRYIGEESILDAWAGAERFPTEGIFMFFSSIAYQGRQLYD